MYFTFSILVEVLWASVIILILNEKICSKKFGEIQFRPAQNNQLVNH